MSKRKTVFRCVECGYSSAKWLGRCPACNAWDTLAEEAAEPESGGGSRSPRGVAKPEPITAIVADTSARVLTGIGDFDRILGGGLVQGSAVLIGGEPGVGKSTLLLQLAHWLARGGLRALYVTAEESAMQLRLRGERLRCLHDNLLVLAENNLDNILAEIDASGAQAAIIDSIQMVYWSELGSAPGSVGQVRECAAALIARAKRGALPLFLVGHVTKDGAIAGPKVLEHMVDVVLGFEGDMFHAARILRATKNRFGAVNEIGVFEMTSRGLSPIDDPSKLFLSGKREHSAGSAVTAPVSGSRPFLVEVQALVAPGLPGNARRKVSGADPNRAAMLLAVLEKRCGITLYDKDVFLNVVGGAEMREPAGDLALAAAVESSLRERAVPADLVIVGEVGLGGEVRPVPQIEARLAEAARLGFARAVIPAGSKYGKVGLRCREVSTIDEAIAVSGER